jgi:hypothetical protein
MNFIKAPPHKSPDNWRKYRNFMRILMKKLLFFVLLCLFAASKAQDTLYFTNSEKKVVVIAEINPDNVKYKRFDNPQGPLYSVNKSDLQQLVFSNGIKEVFNKTEIKPQAAENPVTSETGGSIPDTLFFKSGKTSLVWIKIITGSEVKYKLWNYEDGPDYTASKSELKSVHYANGRTESFDKPAYEYSGRPGGSEYSSPGSGVNYYHKGQADAIRYYRHNGGSVGVGITAALCSPVCGLIPAIPVSLSEPSLSNLGMPKTSYSSNSEYAGGYAAQAYKMKKKKVWRAYGIGSAAYVIATILIIALSSH